MTNEFKFLISVWLVSKAFFVAQRCWVDCFIVVYAFKGFEVDNKAILDIAENLLAVMILGLYSQKFIRRWAIAHTWLVATMGAVLETGALLWFLIDPFQSFLANIFVFSLFFQFWKIQEVERKAAVFENACDRAWFDIASDRIVYLACAIGAAAAMLFQPQIETVIWIGSVATVVSYYLSGCRFYLADKWCRERNIIYPSYR